jgi:hypothetical protein
MSAGIGLGDAMKIVVGMEVKGVIVYTESVPVIR